MECIVNMPFVIRVMVFVYLLTHNYALRRNFSESNTARIVQLLEDEQSQRRVSKRFDISQSGVSRIWKRFWEIIRYSLRPRKGCHYMYKP